MHAFLRSQPPVLLMAIGLGLLLIGFTNSGLWALAACFVGGYVGGSGFFRWRGSRQAGMDKRRGSSDR